MSKLPFKAVVAELTGQIDRLVIALGGEGTDFHERAGSIQHRLDEYEFRQLRSVSIVRRKIAAGPIYQFKGNPRQFVETCEWLIPRLEAHRAKHEELQRETRLSKAAGPAPVPTAAPDLTRGERLPAILVSAGVGVVCLLVLSFFCVHSVERNEWPSGRTYVEEVSSWPVAVFWASLSALAAFRAMVFLARRSRDKVHPVTPPTRV